jgi:hypothetical protein
MIAGTSTELNARLIRTKIPRKSRLARAPPLWISLLNPGGTPHTPPGLGDEGSHLTHGEEKLEETLLAEMLTLTSFQSGRS